MVAVTDITYFEFDQVAAAKFAIYPKIEQRELPEPVLQLQSDPDSPDFFLLEWTLPSDMLALVPWNGTGLFVGFFHVHLLAVVGGILSADSVDAPGWWVE